MKKRPVHPRIRRPVTIDLSGQAAIVTGGSRGIGRACVLALAGAGAGVVFSYLKCRAKARAVEREARRAGGRAIAVRADAARPEDARRLASQAMRRFGRIDILVNNAGVWEPPEGIAIEAMNDAQWSRTHRINLDGAFYCTRAVVPLMKDQRSGRIVNLSSTAGQRGEARHADYASTKGAIISLTKSLATELGPWGIRVNAVAPWWVLTDMSRETLDRVEREGGVSTGEASPLGRVARPDEIAGPVLFLCSDLASFITGEILNVNGGTILCG
jgi:3-oxoacyl-[acyl-carrier protein] reductase